MTLIPDFHYRCQNVQIAVNLGIDILYSRNWRGKSPSLMRKMLKKSYTMEQRGLDGDYFAGLYFEDVSEEEGEGESRNMLRVKDRHGLSVSCLSRDVPLSVAPGGRVEVVTLDDNFEADVTRFTNASCSGDNRVWPVVFTVGGQNISSLNRKVSFPPTVVSAIGRPGRVVMRMRERHYWECTNMGFDIRQGNARHELVNDTGKVDL